MECSLQGVMDDSLLESLLDRIVGLTNYVTFNGEENLYLHRMRFIPKNETPFGPQRNDDIMLTLSSSFVEQGFVKLRDRSWTLSIHLPPEPTVTKSNYRSYYEYEVQGDALEFMTDLGYKFCFEHVVKGYRFYYGDLEIQITKIYKLQDHKVSTMKVLDDLKHRWAVEILSRVPAEQVNRTSQQMLQFASYFAGICEFGRADHVSLTHKIKYSQT